MSTLPLHALTQEDPRHDFGALIDQRGLDLSPRSPTTLQINITALCNQACRHCHVDSSPSRTEALPGEAIDRVIDILSRHPGIGTLDITGGAPELHADFERLARAARSLGRTVIVRHNLTVTTEGNPQTGESKDHLPDLFAELGLEVVCSLPYYQEFFTDKQRGNGVFQKSIAGLKRLNALGYGKEGSGLVLNLVYNPVGPYLPAAQASLEADYRRELGERFGIVFNHLFTITNMPINRFALHLRKSGQYTAYMDKLLAAFNPAAAEGVMCRDLISVGWDGTLYDCDFNQQLGMPIMQGDRPMSLFDFDLERLMARRIRLGAHCLGCTAGAGSSCGGSTAG